MAKLPQDPAHQHRLPPGQVETKGWPVLHYGTVPQVDLEAWNFRVFGLVERPALWTWDEMTKMPMGEVRSDIHCVTHWSKFDNVWEGIPIRKVLELVGVQPQANYVVVHAEGGFTANLPLADLDRDDVLLALRHGGEPLTPDHGWPMRLVVPHLYFWKSAKWVRGLELVERDRPGFWERNGYHMHGDPWLSERYSF